MPKQHVLQDIDACVEPQICLSERGLFNVDLIEIVEALNKNVRIKSVSLVNNNLDDGCISNLCALKHVNKINLSRNNIDAGSLDLSNKFEELDLSNNAISKDTLENMLNRKITCSKLNLQGNSLSDELLERLKQHVKPRVGSVLSRSSPLITTKQSLNRSTSTDSIPQQLIRNGRF